MSIERLVNFAQNISRLASCKRAQVGCIIVDCDWNPIASGYNSGYCVGDHCPAINGEVSCGTLHAELAAIGNIPLGKIPYAAIVTKVPCAKCNKALRSIGIKFIICTI